ncbi:hypothetical protein HPB50_001338 [Hyalomma asiaticum]|uniref:Uncharacterized protein n=1 Tax=Hyalomma asiaticum TaxID=266040 RepID=A0ACB7RHA4_HYAAI|nr:hypothetical protein HPB50_001338 [Hyalomma asiaticum]
MCVPTTDDDYFVCNENPQTYSTFEQCEKECANTGGKGPQCLKEPLIVKCNATFLKVEPHFIDPVAGGCKAWDFPNGSCPNATFRSKASTASLVECEAACRGPGAATKPGCKWPTEIRHCDGSEMLYPFFFTKEFSPRGSCLEGAYFSYNRHRCHNSKNTFLTRQQCESLCYIFYDPP